jgi:hypothetical protein
MDEKERFVKGKQNKRCGGRQGCACSGTVELKQAVEDAVKVMRGGERRLTCAQALELAERFGVEPARVGKLCDAAGIKLRRCQLGCF